MRNTSYGHPDLIRKHEVAQRLCVCTRTVEKWVDAGLIPAVHHPLGKGHGRKVYFDWQAVRKALKLPA